MKNLLLVQGKGQRMQNLEQVNTEEAEGYQFIKTHIS
jgi:hypothetical protein